MGAVENGLHEMWNELVRLCNAQFDSLQVKRLLSLKFSRHRAQKYSIQMAYYVKNRRDCWGYVQGAAPLDVKRLIWHHERDELIGDKDAGKDDHITLAVKEQINNAEHVVMDVEHAHLLHRVAQTHATTDETQNAILRGAKESLLIDRV